MDADGQYSSKLLPEMLAQRIAGNSLNALAAGGKT